MGGNNEAGPGLVSQEAARLYDAAESFEAVDAAAHRALEYGFDSELAERVRELFRNRLQEVNEYLAAHRPELEVENRTIVALMAQIINESAQDGILPIEEDQ